MTRQSLEQKFHRTLADTGLVAILRGIGPEQVLAVGETLYAAGFRLIEVPLNSPDPFASVECLASSLPDDVLIGAGTIMTAQQVRDVGAAGGQLIVMPHGDVEVIQAAVALGLIAVPGVATPTEAFAALSAGASALKAFPAEMLAPAVIKAWRAVVPLTVPLLPVGGITLEGMQRYLESGASGFGLGSALYSPGDSAQLVAPRARVFMRRWLELKAARAQ